MPIAIDVGGQRQIGAGDNAYGPCAEGGCCAAVIVIPDDATVIARCGHHILPAIAVEISGAHRMRPAQVEVNGQRPFQGNARSGKWIEGAHGCTRYGRLVLAYVGGTRSAGPCGNEQGGQQPEGREQHARRLAGQSWFIRHRVVINSTKVGRRRWVRS